MEVGELDEARLLFDRLAAGGFAGVPDDDTRPMCLGLMAEVCVALGDADRAVWLLDELGRVEGRLLVLVGMAACLGPVDRLLGRLMLVAGDRARARQWSERALAFARALESPLWTAYCLDDLAVHIGRDDPAAGFTLLDDAAALCAGRHLVRVEQQVAATRRSLIRSRLTSKNQLCSSRREHAGLVRLVT